MNPYTFSGWPSFDSLSYRTGWPEKGKEENILSKSFRGFKPPKDWKKEFAPSAVLYPGGGWKGIMKGKKPPSYSPKRGKDIASEERVE